MKKIFFSVITLFFCCVVMSGCTKNSPTITTLDPYLTASIGTFDYTAITVAPSSLDTQAHDSTTALVITANSSTITSLNEQIVLTITRYKGLTGVYSIVQSQATADFIDNNGIDNKALGGIVAITHITSNSIIGYFSFNANTGVSVLNGTFSVGKP